MKTINKTISGARTFAWLLILDMALAVLTVFLPYLAALAAGASIVAAISGIMILNEARDLKERQFWQAAQVTKRITADSSKLDFDEDLLRSKDEPKTARQEAEAHMDSLNEFAPHE